MQTRRRKSREGMAAAGLGLLAAGAAMLVATETAYPQAVRAAPRVERCKELARQDVRKLNDQELRLLKSCFEPLEQRAKEKKGSVEESLPSIEQRAPLRIYGK